MPIYQHFQSLEFGKKGFLKVKSLPKSAKAPYHAPLKWEFFYSKKFKKNLNSFFDMHIISCHLKKSIFEINHLHIFIFKVVFAKLCAN